MQQIIKTMANLQSSSSSGDPRTPAVKNPYMKAPECFHGTQNFKVRSFIQSCKLIFENDQENFPKDRKKVPYSTLFLIGKASKVLNPSFPISPIKTKNTFSITGSFMNPNYSPYLETQMKLERLKQSWMVSE
ncbi:hypothetical protein O181_023662 [Austropuccinia psidii MF-1]|uniref:Uncharacterized protein n=1 Tax=Austropuccinia psidii MF-1 TaxID=1389203 RepID=A0A9Q3CJY7_9BASI|nr:hypothetical protein [Austropuccinia psidii MF-1]